jgi:hypothetical protein
LKKSFAGFSLIEKKKEKSGAAFSTTRKVMAGLCPSICVPPFWGVTFMEKVPSCLPVRSVTNPNRLGALASWQSRIGWAQRDKALTQ